MTSGIRLSLAKTLSAIFNRKAEAEAPPKDPYDLLIDLAAPLQALGYNTTYLFTNEVFVVSHDDSDRSFLISIKEKGDETYIVVEQVRLPRHMTPGNKTYGKPSRFLIDSLDKTQSRVLDYIKSIDAVSSPVPKIISSLKKRFPKLNVSYAKALGDYEKVLRLTPLVSTEVLLRYLPRRDRWQLVVHYVPAKPDPVLDHAIRNLESIIEHGLTTKDLLGSTGDRVARLLNQAALSISSLVKMENEY
jgi:hypothetical protein